MKNFYKDAITTIYPKVRIIWNLTKICPWDCKICCVDAFHVKRQRNTTIVRTHSLSKTHTIKVENQTSIFEMANKYLISNELELSLYWKLKVLNNLNVNAKIDFSGGDPLLLKDNILLIEKAAHKFGKNNISITATGIGFAMIDHDRLMQITNNIDFTYDSAESFQLPYRPIPYNTNNLQKVSLLKSKGMNITAQIPLSNSNISRKSIEAIYLKLHQHGIDKILLMKIYHVGRGSNLKMSSPSISEYQTAIEIYKQLEAIYKYPTIKIQTGLKEVIDENAQSNNDYTSSYLAITQLGILSQSPWAYDHHGNPIQDHVIGDLKSKSLSDLLNITLKQETKYKNFLYYFVNKAASILF